MCRVWGRWKCRPDRADGTRSRTPGVLESRATSAKFFAPEPKVEHLCVYVIINRMRTCDQEMCPMWDGHGCPCAQFDIDRDDLPDHGTFIREIKD